MWLLLMLLAVFWGYRKEPNPDLTAAKAMIDQAEKELSPCP